LAFLQDFKGFWDSQDGFELPCLAENLAKIMSEEEGLKD
jgi:hypothetical protein